MTRPLGLAPLSLVGCPPPVIVDAAAVAGYDFVGLRVRPVTPTEPAYDLQPGSPLLTEVQQRLADTEITVVDIEFLLLDGATEPGALRETWTRMYEAGAALGARTLTVAAGDTDRPRLIDTLGLLVEDGRPYGITPTLEAISYQAVRTLADAHDVARQTGAQILLDTLHLGRVETEPEDVAAYVDLLPLVQVCDGPMPGPQSVDDRIVESRSKRLVPGTGDLRVGEVLTHLPADLPVSVETPDPAHVHEVGARAWAKQLHDATTSLIDGLEAVGAP